MVCQTDGGIARTTSVVGLGCPTIFFLPFRFFRTSSIRTLTPASVLETDFTLAFITTVPFFSLFSAAANFFASWSFPPTQRYTSVSVQYRSSPPPFTIASTPSKLCLLAGTPLSAASISATAFLHRRRSCLHLHFCFQIQWFTDTASNRLAFPFVHGS